MKLSRISSFSILRLVIFILLLLFPWPCIAQEQNFSVSGKITDAISGLPLSGALVTLFAVRDTEDTRTYYSATTNEQGEYSISGTAVLQYFLSFGVEHSGYTFESNGGDKGDPRYYLTLPLDRSTATYTNQDFRGWKLEMPSAKIYKKDNKYRLKVTLLGFGPNYNGATRIWVTFENSERSLGGQTLTLYNYREVENMVINKLTAKVLKRHGYRVVVHAEDSDSTEVLTRNVSVKK